MSGDKEEKQYGLILRKKQQGTTSKITNVFGDNDDSDEEDGTDWVKKALQAEGEKNKIKKQTKLNMQKALKEDPTIFQYDEVYEHMERTKEKSEDTKEEKKKPRYILNLLKAAERRKKEQEYRIERMVQKEREAEGEMFADKESFVTSAYRSKLEEFKKMEEEESKMDRLEAIADVKKQQDMSGFYRHLFEQTVESPGQKPQVPDNKNESLNTDAKDAQKDVNEDVANKESIKNKEAKKNRQYRQRIVDEDSDAEAEVQQTESDVNTSVIEKRKVTEDNVIDTESEVKKQKQEPQDGRPRELDNETKSTTTTNSEEKEEESENPESNEKAEKASASAKAKIEAEKKERSKIWEKRTIGPVFDAALQRYYARKAARLTVVQ